MFCNDFHDFDVYQYTLKEKEIRYRIKTYLEKDDSIAKFYKLTPEALYIGDLENDQIDYVLYLSSHVSRKPNPSMNQLKNARIAIDPGHLGGQFAEWEERYLKITKEDNDPIYLREGNLTYLTALKLKQLLEDEGAIVLMTRQGIGQGAIQVDLKNASHTFHNFYNKADLIARAEKINSFYPDITIVIHYNTHWIDQKAKDKNLLTQSNYNLAFIPGAFCKGELDQPQNRYEFLRLLLTDDLDRSLQLSQHIVAQFVAKLQVPLISPEEKTSYTQSSCLIQSPGIYCRNLALTRLVHSPICYGETLIQNHIEEAFLLGAKDDCILGIPCSKRVLEVAKAYFEGIKNYFASIELE